MKKIWIVVANSTYSRIYRAENNQKLVEIKYLEHLESHMRARELVSDSQGRSTNVGLYGSDTMEHKTSLKDKESMSFANQIITYLEEACKNGDCERIYIVAKAPFLGNLRTALPPSLAHLVHAEISKDLTHLTASQVREYLPPTL